MNEWKPIETAPKDGSHILLYRKTGIQRIAVGYMRKGWSSWSAMPGTYGWDNVTHWMPLPEPPK